MANELDVMERTITRNGWKAGRTGGGHRRWCSPEGAVVIVAMTSSDKFRSVANTAREMKRLGYNPDGTKVPDAQFLATQQELARAAAEASAQSNQEREERRLQERLEQSLRDQQAPPSTNGSVTKLLDHELLLFDVVDAPPFSEHANRQRKDKQTQEVREQRAEVERRPLFTPPISATTRPQEKEVPTMAPGVLNVDALLDGAVESTPRSAAVDVWYQVFERLPVGRWMQMPGMFSGGQVQQVQKVAKDNADKGWKARSESSITSSERTLWLRVDA